MKAKKNKTVLTGKDAAKYLSGGRKSSQETFGLFGEYYMLPVIFALAIIPLIVYAVIYDSGLPSTPWFEGGAKFDVFLIQKGYFLYFTGIVMAVAMAVKLADDEARGIIKSGLKWIIPMCVFGALALISTLVSPFRAAGLSLIGGYEQHESVWIILCYCMLIIYTYLVVTDEHCVEIIRVCLGFVACVEALLGISQYTGHDFFSTSLGRHLMVSNKLAQYRDSLTFTFSGTGTHQVYLTFYNPNYVGVYVTLMVPICAILIISSKAVWKKIWWALMLAGTMVCALGCGSKSFMISFVITFLAALLFYRKKLLKGWPILAALIVIMIVGGSIFFIHANVNPFTYITKAMFTKSSADEYIKADFGENSVIFEYKGKPFSIAIEGEASSSAITVKDEGGADIPLSVNEDGYTYSFEDDTLDTLSLSRCQMQLPEGTIYYLSLINNTNNQLYNRDTYHIDFTKTDEGYKYVTSIGKTDDVYNAPSAVFTDNVQFASGRGYIWSRTIPLLGKYFILGAGADGFTQAFPQTDYIGKANSGYLGLIITKPHNMYLQTGINEGVIALICELAVFFIYLIGSARLYWKAELSDEITSFGLAINIGIFGYLIAAIMNDSCLALAPIFWILLGAGFAINRIVDNKLREATDSEDDQN